LKTSDMGFLKTEPKLTTKFKNRKLNLLVQFFKPTLADWGWFFSLFPSQLIFHHDTINTRSIILWAASLHF